MNGASNEQLQVRWFVVFLCYFFGCGGRTASRKVKRSESEIKKMGFAGDQCKVAAGILCRRLEGDTLLDVSAAQAAARVFRVTITLSSFIVGAGHGSAFRITVVFLTEGTAGSLRFEAADYRGEDA